MACTPRATTKKYREPITQSTAASPPRDMTRGREHNSGFVRFTPISLRPDNIDEPAVGYLFAYCNGSSFASMPSGHYEATTLTSAKPGTPVSTGLGQADRGEGSFPKFKAPRKTWCLICLLSQEAMILDEEGASFTYHMSVRSAGMSVCMTFGEGCVENGDLLVFLSNK